MSEGNFYEKATVPAGEANLIKDPDVAHELAIIEASMGRDKALTRELELKRQNETGLTDKERHYMAFNEGLVAKYPHSFSVEIGQNGKVYYEIKPVLEYKWQEDHSLSRDVLTPDGILVVTPSAQDRTEKDEFRRIMKNVNTAELMTIAQDGAKREGKPLEEKEMNISKQIGNDYLRNAKVRMLDPFGSDNNSLGGVKYLLQKVEADHLQHEQNTIKAVPSVAEALAKF